MSMWVGGKLAELGWPFLCLCGLGWEQSPCHFRHILLGKGSHGQQGLFASGMGLGREKPVAVFANRLLQGDLGKEIGAGSQQVVHEHPATNVWSSLESKEPP